jgi:hypothetical protein
MSEVAFQLELAFAKAQTMTESNSTIYEANFETNRVQEISDGYSCWSIPPGFSSCTSIYGVKTISKKHKASMNEVKVA